VSCVNYDFIKIHENGCAYEVLGATTTIGTMWDLAMTPSGRLFGIKSGTIYEFDTITAAYSLLCSTLNAPFSNEINNLVALSDDFLLCTIANGVYKVNLNSCEIDQIGVNDLFYGSSGDLVFYKGYYYMSKVNNDLIRFKINDNFTDVFDVTLVGKMNTPLFGVYGLVTLGTSDCSADECKLVAIEGWTMYDVNVENAYCTVICDSVASGGVFGAASQTDISKQLSFSEYVLPNVFTPNNDGVNDYFQVLTKFNVKESLITIVNRWGNVLYETNGNDFSWDGKNQVKDECHDGVYFYIIRYRDFCDKWHGLTGNFTLIR
jgi:gliding motility-associated-like protein